MKKVVLIPALLLLVLSALIAVDPKSDSVDIKLSYEPVYSVLFVDQEDGSDIPPGPSDDQGPFISGKTANEFGGKKHQDDPSYDTTAPTQDDAKTLRFYVKGTTNYPMSSYPKTTVSWEPLTMVGTSTTFKPTLGVDVYVATATIDNNGKKTTMDKWLDGEGTKMDFRQNTAGASEYESSVTFSGFQDSVAVTGEHTFYMRFVALVPYSEYKNAYEGQYMTTFQLTVEGA